MQSLTFQDLEILIRNKELSYYNVYNLDIPVQSQYAAKYYQNHSYDTIDINQNISILFLDIEFFSNFKDPSNIKDAKQPINAITTSFTKEKKFKSYFLLNDQNFKKFGIQEKDFDFDTFIKKRQDAYLKTLVEKKYLDNSFEIEISIFNDELELLQAFWQDLHQMDPVALSGWNCDRFDMPYLYYRTTNLIGSKIETDRIVSKFGYVNARENLIHIPEFVIADLLYLYKPRSEMGLNLGKTQPQYTLDWVSEAELKLKKLEYKDKKMSLDELYLTDPETFLLYNIIDTILVRKLNKKLKHIDLQNLIRRVMTSTFSQSLSGSSVIFDTLVFQKLSNAGKFVRFGINNEQTRSLDIDDVKDFPIPYNKKWQIKPVKINSKQYQDITTKYPGAFVKSPHPTIINDGTIVIDLDATALYPSLILQNNISFDSYQARILPPCTYKTIQLLNTVLSKNNYPTALPESLFKMAVDYVAVKNITRKKTTITNIYYILMYLFQTLHKANLPFSQIIQPKTDKEITLLKTYLIPLLDLINLIHPANLDYNQFVYDYLFMQPDDLTKKYNILYVIHNVNSSYINIQPHSLLETLELFKKYSGTLAGTLFNKHEEHTGLFTDFLNQTGNLRGIYQKKMAAAEKGSDEYIFNNARQKSIKVVRNTSYGLYGQKSFRYSNNWLAQSITNQAVLSIKMAQYLTEQHLKFKYDLEGDHETGTN